MFIFLSCLLCAKYLFPLSNKLEEYIAMKKGQPIRLVKVSARRPMFNPHAAVSYMPAIKRLSFGQLNVGNGRFREPVYEGNGEWDVIFFKEDNSVALKNGPWCLTVRKELLVISDPRALVLMPCVFSKEQKFWIYSARP